jgi:hypothetical protein
VATIDDLFNLVTEFCTFEQIKSVLESARGNKGVRLSAPNKGELLNKNLREALDANALPLERVYDLLRDAEENGDQHVLYFRVPKTLQKSFTFEEFGNKLALSNTLTKSFPRLDLVPNGYSIADFRTLEPRRPTDWILKFYGDETREFFTGRIVPEVGTKHLKEYDVRRYRHVLIVRWNFPDLLELRIPRDTARGRRMAWIEYLWKAVAAAVQPGMLKPWDLSQTRRNLIEQDKLEGDVFSLRDTQVMMPGQERATFEPYLPGAGLFSAEYAKAAVRELLNAHSTCTRLNVSWLPRKGADFEEIIRTTIGTDQSNEVIFPSHQKASEMDYVTDQLRRFSKNS